MPCILCCNFCFSIVSAACRGHPKPLNRIRIICTGITIRINVIVKKDLRICNIRATNNSSRHRVGRILIIRLSRGNMPRPYIIPGSFIFNVSIKAAARLQNVEVRSTIRHRYKVSGVYCIPVPGRRPDRLKHRAGAYNFPPIIGPVFKRITSTGCCGRTQRVIVPSYHFLR